MRIVIAPDSFKESMSAKEAAHAMAGGVLRGASEAPASAATSRKHVNVIELPISDGGEGFLAAVCGPLRAEMRQRTVEGSMGAPVVADFGWVDDKKLALVEVAQIVGPHRVNAQERDIWTASSVGVGQMLAYVRNLGARQIIVGLGGTITNDGGLGVAGALGVTLLDSKGEKLAPTLASVETAQTLKLSGALRDFQTNATPGETRRAQQWENVQVILATDVDAPLVGARGASVMFGPQKGASAADVLRLDEVFEKWATLLEAATGVDVTRVEGGGAAGGIGAALVALTGASIVPGIDLVLDLSGFDDLLGRLEPGDLVFTGEGKVDRQTLEGKAPWGVCRRALEHGIRTVAFCGVRGPGAEELIGPDGFLAVIQISPSDGDTAGALRHGAQNLTQSVAEFVKTTLSFGGSPTKDEEPSENEMS